MIFLFCFLIVSWMVEVNVLYLMCGKIGLEGEGWKWRFCFLFDWWLVLLGWKCLLCFFIWVDWKWFWRFDRRVIVDVFCCGRLDCDGCVMDGMFCYFIWELGFYLEFVDYGWSWFLWLFWFYLWWVSVC